ncbi:MAG: Uma2 family endonuclease [Gemmataceae bacterium]
MQSMLIDRSPRTREEYLTAFGRPLQRISVEQYHQMIDAGVFSHGERCELIRGVILEKPVPKPPHSYTVDVLSDLLRELVGAGFVVRTQQPVTTGDSEPEPDVVLAIGSRRDYRSRHPVPDDVAILVEVADTSVRDDRTTKLTMYAEAGIGSYWIVDLTTRTVVVFTQPRGGRKPSYRKATAYQAGDQLPLVLNGKRIGFISVDDILP